MKLYYVEGSPNCQKVMAVINHLEISVDIEYLDISNSDLNTPEYLAVNPNGKVPAIVDGDLALWETNAIMQYLADTAPSNILFPPDSRVRADITRWQCWEVAHYNKAFIVLIFETVIKQWMKKGEPDQTLIEYEKGNLSRYAGVLEKYLNNRSYIVGDGVTLADYSLIFLEKFRDRIPFDWSHYPNINAYYRRISGLPYWANKPPARPETKVVNS